MWVEKLVIRYLDFLDAQGQRFNLIAGLACAGSIGVFDLTASPEVTHSFLYLLPISFVTWFSGRRAGFAVLAICMALWSGNNISSNMLITTWNILSTLSFFVAIAALVDKTRRLLENERQLARSDHLTGAWNMRAFAELVEHDMHNSRRTGQSFSLAYVDIDNFKTVNDTFGHARGDELLRTTVAEIIGSLRTTDIVGRLGGDEFAIFFPATDQVSVKTIMAKIVGQLAKLADENSWPISFSAGVVTCRGGVYDLNAIIASADFLMYQVKKAGKNSISYAEYPLTDSVNFP